MRTLPIVFVALLATSLFAQDRAPDQTLDKKPLQAADYGQWESLRGSGTLSPDGRWLAYDVGRSNGDDELRLLRIDGDERHAFAHGKAARFSDDSRWLAFLVGIGDDAREQLEKAKKPVQDSFRLRELATGETIEVDGVSDFRFDEYGSFVAYKRYRPKDQKKGGSDLIVRDLDSGAEVCFGNIGAYAWSEKESLLAMSVDTADMVGGGVNVLDATYMKLRVLDSHKARYTRLTWRKEAADLAFLRITEHDEDEDEQPSHVVIAWRDLEGQVDAKSVFDHRQDAAFPAGMRVVDGALKWRDAGDAVFFGIRKWEHPPKPKSKTTEEPRAKDEAKDGGEPADDAVAKPKPDATAQNQDGKSDKKQPKSLRETLKDPAGVDIWHAKDARIIPQQKKEAGRDRQKSQLCAFWLTDDKFVRLGDETVDTVTVLEQGRTALGRDTTRHERIAMFGPELSDVYLIDTRIGDRRRILEQHKFVYGSSPDGNHLLYVKDDTWHVHDVRTDTARALTAGIDAHFIDDERGVLTDENPPYGIAGWFADSSAVILNSRFDLWVFPMDGGTPERWTKGAEDQNEYRLLDLDPDEEWVDPTQPLYLSVTGERTKQSGFAVRTEQGVQTLRLADRRLTGLQKAKHADVFVFNEQSQTDSPDVFAAGPFLAEPKQLSHTNTQQPDYAWSQKSELIDYQSTRGAALQGALFYPANYEPGKLHPMIVYIYEKRSQNLHSYSAPSERSPYNPSVFTSLGYFVYQPDIVYRAQNPGISALECVVPAVQAVLAKGEVDPDRVGLVGHSWGAYQTAFIVTRSELFAAGVAGAPLTNMMSMSMSIYWNSGSTDARIFHESQGRMDKPFWQDVETYMANSPIFGMDSLQTPLLIAFGDEDGAVDWHQGIEMYNAARLADKQLVMLVYEGENHSLRKKPNQVDYHWRVREWFGHYLKGEPAPKWITEGTSFLDREEQLKELERKQKARGKQKADGDDKAAGKDG